MGRTFNELLLATGIDPPDVLLLRHHTTKYSKTPYELWQTSREQFELYQSTQVKQPKFRNHKYWAAFVVGPKTTFAGLYEVALQPGVVADWQDPITGGAVGERRGRNPYDYDVFEYRLLDELSEHIGALTVDWPPDAVRAWAQRAVTRADLKTNLSEAEPVPELPHREGAHIWRLQRTAERSPELRKAAKLKNRQGGKQHCEACGFRDEDGRLFDVHHLKPIALGERHTSEHDLVVLCPTCHRSAHLPDRLRPKPLQELREWAKKAYN